MAVVCLALVASALPGPLSSWDEPQAEAAPTGVPATQVGTTPPRGERAEVVGEELVERRTKASKTFATEHPGKFKTQVFAQPVHFPDGHGRWADIDTTLVEKIPGRLHPRAGPVSVEMASDHQDSALARVSLDADHSIEFGVQGAGTGTGHTVRATVAYKGIRPHSDLELTATPYGLKEDIVLSSPQAPDTFVFPLRLKGLTASLDAASGEVIYRDQSGKQRALTPRGFMVDSNVDPRTDEAKKSSGVTYALGDDGHGGLALTVSLDRAWLDDPARVYPVRVDPSFSVIRDTEDDTFVKSPFNADNAFDHVLDVGTDNGGPTWPALTCTST